MAHLRLIPLHSIGLGFARYGRVNPRCIDEFAIGGLRRFVHHRLQRLLFPMGFHGPAQNATAAAVNQRHDIDTVFLSPTKVYSSSSAALLTSPGTGAVGN